MLGMHCVNDITKKKKTKNKKKKTKKKKKYLATCVDPTPHAMRIKWEKEVGE